MKLPLVILLTASLTSYGQSMTYDNGAVIQHVINVEGSASDLYKAVERWVIKTYNSPDRVITGRIENEQIKGNGFSASALVLVAATNTRNDLKYSFTIEVKDGKIRYTMYSMRAEIHPIEAYIYKKDGSEKTNGQAKSVKASAEEVANGLVQSLEAFLNNKEKGGDW